MSFNNSKNTFTLTLLFAVLALGYSYGATAVAPAIISCTQESWTTYSTDGTNSPASLQPAWFESWRTATKGFFSFEFTTNALQDICIAFNPTLLTSISTTPLIGLRIGASGNTQIFTSANAPQGSIGLGNGMISAAGGAIPNNYDATAAGFTGPATTIKVEFDIINKTLRLWSKKPSDTSYPATPFFDSTAPVNATFATNLTSLLNTMPTATTAQYIGFSNGYKAHQGSLGKDVVQYGNVIFPSIAATTAAATAATAAASAAAAAANAAPAIISCTQEAWTTYSTNASNDSATMRPAWFENWKSSVPGYFLFEFTTNTLQDACIAINSSLINNVTLNNSASTPLVGLRIGGSGNTQIVMSANQPQGAIGVGSNLISAPGGAIPNNYDATAAGFTGPATTIKVEFDIINKTLRLWSKKPSDTSYSATPFFDSTAPANATFATNLTSLLNTVPTAATAQYIGFSNGYKAHQGSLGKDVVQYGNVIFPSIAQIAASTFSAADWKPTACAGYSILEFSANVSDSANGKVAVIFSPENNLVAGKSLILNLGLDGKETYIGNYANPVISNKYSFPLTDGRSFLKPGNNDYRIEYNQSQAYLLVWRKAAGAPASTYQQILTYPDGALSGDRSAFPPYRDATNNTILANVSNSLAVAGTGATITNVSTRIFLAQETTPPASLNVSTGGDTIFPSFFESWKLPADGRGIIEVTAKINPFGNPPAPMLASSAYICFMPAPEEAGSLNLYDDCFAFLLRNMAPDADHPLPFSSIWLRNSVLPGVNNTNLPNSNLIFNPGTVLLKNASPDNLSTVPVDLRFSINQRQGLFSVDIKANGADASTYTNIFSYREGQPLSAPNATPSAAAPNVFASITGKLKYVSFSAYHASSLWSNVIISALNAALPAGFTLDENFNGQEICIQTDTQGNMSAYAISADNSLILIKKPFTTGTWSQLATTGLSGSITSLATNNDGEIYATLSTGATYKASTTSTPFVFTQVAGANKGPLISIASGKANNLLIVDDHNTLWRLVGIGVQAIQDGPTGVLVSNVSQAADGTVYLVDTSNNAWKGIPGSTNAPFTWTQLPTPVGDTAPAAAPMALESIVGLSATSAMAITSHEEIVVYDGTQWALMPVSATDATPANGFARIAANTAGKIALIDFNGMLFTNFSGSLAPAPTGTPAGSPPPPPVAGTQQQQADAYLAYLAAQNTATEAALKTATALSDLNAAKTTGQTAAIAVTYAAYTVAKTAADAAAAALATTPTDAAKIAANTTAQATLTSAQNNFIKACGVTTLTDALTKAGNPTVGTQQQQADAYIAYLAAQNTTTEAALKTATGLSDLNAAKTAGQTAAIPITYAAYSTAKTAADTAAAALATATADTAKQAANTAAQTALNAAENNFIKACGVTTLTAALAKSGHSTVGSQQQQAAAYTAYTAAETALNKNATTKKNLTLKAKLTAAATNLQQLTGETTLAKAITAGKAALASVKSKTPAPKLAPKKKPTPPRRRVVVKKAAPKNPIKK